MKNKKVLHRKTKFKPFIDKYNWEGTNYLSEKEGWKKGENNNLNLTETLVKITISSHCKAF